jgi:hypothetical protein
MPDDHLTTMVFRSALAITVLAMLALHRAALMLLRQMEEHHAVRWSDLGLPTARWEAMARGGGGWRMQHFIWSKDIDQVDDGTVRRCGFAMRIATVVVGAALSVILFTAATHGWQRRRLVEGSHAPAGRVLGCRNLAAGQLTVITA